MSYKMPLIDIHTHILPGMDDGARDMDEALLILRALAAEGITKVVATPHVIPGGYDHCGRAIADAVGLLQKRADADGITIEILVGAENYITPDLPERIAKDKGLTIAGGQFVLAEFPMQAIPPYAVDVVQALVANQLQPIIAHPERNADIVNDASRVLPLLQAGAILQINAGSFMGLQKIMKAGHPFVIASDIHYAEDAAALSRAVGRARALFAPEATGYLNASQFI
jgi:protein-tyrosine phosphatase